VNIYLLDATMTAEPDRLPELWASALESSQNAKSTKNAGMQQ
jgi:hypothetical protein